MGAVVRTVQSSMAPKSSLPNNASDGAIDVT